MKKLSLTSPKTSFKEGTTLYLDSEDNTQCLLLIRKFYSQIHISIVTQSTKVNANIWLLKSISLCWQLLTNIEMILFKMFGAILIHNLFNTMTQACSQKVYFYSFLKAQKKEGDLAAFCSRDQRHGPLTYKFEKTHGLFGYTFGFHLLEMVLQPNKKKRIYNFL